MADKIFPLDTVVRIKKTGEFAVIKSQAFLNDGKNFLHYLGVIEGRGDGLWALFHDDLELECLPSGTSEDAQKPQTL
jgi:hypothetical protein